MNVLRWFKRNSTGSEPTSPLTEEHDETLKTQLGMGILQSLDNRDVMDEVARKNRRWNDLNLGLAKSRLGIHGDSSDTKAAEPDAMPGHTVRIDSPDEHHYHYGGKILPWVMAAALGAGGSAATYLATRPEKQPPPPATDTDTSLTIEGH